MAARGIKITWDGAGNVCYASTSMTGADRILFASEDCTLTCWVRVKGDKPGTSASALGHVIAQLGNTVGSGANVRMRATDADNTFQHSPFTFALAYTDTTFAEADVANSGDVVDTDEDWFFAFTWDTTTNVLTFYRVIDGGTIASSASGALAMDENMDRLRLGTDEVNTRGGNFEITNVKLWKRLFNSAEVDAERTSEAPVITTGLVGDWRLPSTSDLSNSFGGAGNWDDFVLTTAGTGTITNGTMDPVDIQGGGGGGPSDQVPGMYGIQRLENGFGPAPAAGLQGVLAT